MKNNKSKRNAFMWKHLKAGLVFSLPYMRSKTKYLNKKRTERWDIKEFRRIVLDLFAAAGTWPNSSPGDRAAVMTKGVYLDYSNMKFYIQGHGYGVTRNKKTNGKGN